MSLTLTVTEGPHVGREFQFESHEVFLVGRSSKAHFQLGSEDRHFSRVHFMVEVNPPHCRLIDLGSRNGTYINDQRVVIPRDLSNGDRIRAGLTVLSVSLDDHATMVRRDDEPTLSLKTPPPVDTPQDGPTLRCGGCGGEPGEGPPWLCGSCAEQATGMEQLVPNYRLLAQVGGGGMGVVFRAVHEKTGLPTAMKLIRPAVAGDDETVNRLMHEAAVLRHLDHPHIVSFREMGEADGRLFFAMDFIDGTDAEELLEQRGRLKFKSAVRLIIQVLDALAYAHAAGFVHRDIKPANILVGQRDRKRFAVLADFGLAGVYKKSMMSGLSIAPDGRSGTPRFMAPEQLSDIHGVNPAADQYSAAATLYRLLTGCFTYDFPPTPEWMLMLLEDDPVPITRRCDDIPAGLAEVVHRALAREPGDRFENVKAFRKALKSFGEPRSNQRT